MTARSAAKTTGTVKRTARAATCVLGLAGAALSAQHAVAQQAGALASGRPGQVVETIAPAATVVSTVHYQAQLTLACEGDSCRGDFPNPGARRRLTVTRMNCFMESQSGATFSWGAINLQTSDTLSQLLYEFLPVDYSASDGRQTINSAVDVQVAARQHISVNLVLATGNASDGFCTETGTLDTLQ